MVQFYLKVDLSDDELGMLQGAVLSFYGQRVQRQGGVLIAMDKETFKDFIGKSKLSITLSFSLIITILL